MLYSSVCHRANRLTSRRNDHNYSDRPLSKLSGELLGARPHGACLQACGPDFFSLRSKRFRVVSEQRKMTEERRGTGISVLAGRKMERERGLFLSIHFSHGQERKSLSLFFAPKPQENVCYAGYDFFVSFHINFRPLNSLGELRDEP